MTEQDAQLLHDAKALSSAPLVQDLLELIERRDKELAVLKEAGEPFREFYDYAKPEDNKVLMRHYKRSKGGIMVDQYGRTIYGGSLRRLAEALDKIEEVKG